MFFNGNARKPIKPAEMIIIGNGTEKKKKAVKARPASIQWCIFFKAFLETLINAVVQIHFYVTELATLWIKVVRAFKCGCC